MREDFYISLIYKQLNGETTDEENRQLEEWLLQDETHQAIANEIQLVYAMSDDYLEAEAADVDVNAAFEKQMVLQGEVQPTPLKVVSNNTKTTETKIKRLGMTRVRWIGAAAASVVLAIAGFWWATSSPDSYEIVAANDGKVVELKDGSTVTLSKGSILKYTPSYNKTDRNVKLTGQAVFDVEKGTTPFVVKTTHSEVKVLGTQFDLKDDVKGKLVYLKVTEGKVNIKLTDGENMDLEAGQQVTGDALAKRFKMPKPVPRSVSRNFSFENEPIEKVIENIGLVYGVDITFDERMKNCDVTLIANDEALEDVLNKMNKILGSSTIEESDGSYLIEGEGCDE